MEDVGEQVAKLVSDDIILLGGDEFYKCLLFRLYYDHFYILLYDKYFIPLFYGLVSLSKDFLSQQMS